MYVLFLDLKPGFQFQCWFCSDFVVPLAIKTSNGLKFGKWGLLTGEEHCNWFLVDMFSQTVRA